MLRQPVFPCSLVSSSRPPRREAKFFHYVRVIRYFQPCSWPAIWDLRFWLQDISGWLLNPWDRLRLMFDVCQQHSYGRESLLPYFLETAIELAAWWQHARPFVLIDRADRRVFALWKGLVFWEQSRRQLHIAGQILWAKHRERGNIAVDRVPGKILDFLSFYFKEIVSCLVSMGDTKVVF